MSQPIRAFQLGGRARKAVRLTHIVAAALWLGLDIAFGILVLTAVLTDDPHTAGTALQVLEMFAIWPMLGASLLCLASGVVLGLGTKYGLIRYWWVAVKLAVNVAMATLIAFSLRPGIHEAARLGRRLTEGSTTAGVPADLLYPVGVAPTLLITAYVLAVFKPWAPIRRRAAIPAAQPTPI